METIVVHGKQHLNSVFPGGGAMIHYAAQQNNSTVCSILAAQVKFNSCCRYALLL